MNFLTRMERLINLCLRKDVKVRAGVNACTDGVDTIYLPPLPEKATPEEVLLHENFAFHEKAHFIGKSDPKGYLKGKLQHRLTNAFDDIRCEMIQEKEWTGIKYERRDFYRLMYEKSPNRFQINKKPDVYQFVYQLTCYMIFKWRCDNLGVDDLEITASLELLKAFDKYVSDLKSLTLKQRTQDDSVALAQKLYDRIKDMIKDELEEKKKQEKEDKKKYEDTDSGGSPEESEDDSSEEPDDSSSDDNSENGEPGEPEDGEPDKSSGSESEDEESEDEGLTPEEQEEVEKEVQKILSDFEDYTPGEDADPYTEVKRIIEHKAHHVDRAYMVDPNVHDHIVQAEEGEPWEADNYKVRGLRILGPEGAQMTKLFVSQSAPRILRNQYEGRFDMRSFMADPMDKRRDVYSSRIRGKLEKAAVLIMIDLSGSMRGSRIETAMSVAQGLVYYLDRASVPTMVAGFTTIGVNDNDLYRDIPIRIERFKEFHERFTGQIGRKLTPPENYTMQNNSEYDAMVWGVPFLFKRPEKRKILMVIGDGEPLLGSNTINNKMGRAYKEYLQLCRDAGIITYGFGIDADLSEYFGKDFVRTDSEHLGSKMVRGLKDALTRR